MNKKEVKSDSNIINHLRNIKLLQAISEGKKLYIECTPIDKEAKCFPNSNLAIKEIELPNFDLFEEKNGYKWTNEKYLEQENKRLRSEFERIVQSARPSNEREAWIWIDITTDIVRTALASNEGEGDEMSLADREIERLKGLVEKEFRQRMFEFYCENGHDISEIDRDWNEFKKENNL